MLGFNAIGLDAVGMSGAPTAQAGPSITLTGAACSQGNTSGAGAVTVTQGTQAVNLVGAASVQTATSSTGAASVTPAAKTVNLVGSASVQTAQSSAGAASVVAANSPTGSVTVPASRTAKFAGRSRLIVFSGSKPVTYQKGPLDELYLVGDFSRDQLEAGSAVSSVAPVSGGVNVLEAPVLQNGFGVVKVGALDLAAPRMFFTFRITLTNGEQIDRTIEFTALDDRKSFPKDPDDKRFYVLDFGADAVFGGTALSSVSAPVPVGVVSLAQPTLQGNAATLKIGGLDTADNAQNSVGLWANFANTERIFRSIYFTQEEH